MAAPIGELARSRNGTWSRRDPTMYGGRKRPRTSERFTSMRTMAGPADARGGAYPRTARLGGWSSWGWAQRRCDGPGGRVGTRGSKRTKPHTHAPVIPLPVRPARMSADTSAVLSVALGFGWLGTKPKPLPPPFLSFLSCPDRADAAPH
jgi:hypothetical protein